MNSRPAGLYQPERYRKAAPAPARLSQALLWRVRGWDLAAFYEESTIGLRGLASDDEMRVIAVRDHWPTSSQPARAAMRDGWRRHRAGLDPW